MKNLKRTFASFALAGFCLAASAQSIQVKGRVTSPADPDGIIGATVREAGTQNATITDMDGNFTLNVKPGTKLIISYIGFDDQEVVAADNMNITLQEQQNELNEVIVTGYTVQRKADLTGAVGVVGTKDIKSSSTDPMSSLQGKVAGMTITSTGSPSGEANISIRGIGSMGGSSTAPLFIIDGVPSTSSINTLNSADIESMQVLKDAASASIYGSRASNGVIIITTKKGKKSDKVNVNFNASLTLSHLSNKMKLLNSQEYATALVQAALNDGKNPYDYAQNYGLSLTAANGTPITVFDPATMSYVNYSVGGYYDGYINQNKTMLYSDTDWMDEISRTGVTQNYDVSFSGGSDRATTLVSFGYKKATGVLKYTDFNNFTGRVNTTYKINNIISVGENLSISYSSNVDSQPMENTLKMASILPVYEVDGTTFSGPVGGMSDRQNPLRELYDNRDNRLKKWRTFGNVYVDIKPIKGLTLRSNFGLDYTNSRIRSVVYTWDSDVVKNSTNSSTMSNTNITQWTWSNTAQYNFDLPGEHNFNVLLGLELNNYDYEDNSGKVNDFVLEDYNYMWPNAGTGIQRVTGTGESYRLASFFGKIDYNWQDLVLASFTLRRDGSSRFGENNRYGTFPAASLGYRLSKHIDADWLHDLKLRASWGITGNQAMNSNTARYGIYLADYGTGRDTSTAYDLDLIGSGTFPSGYRQSQSENKDLKWESTTQYNLGLDFQLFGGSLYGSYDMFLKKTKDMLVQPSYLGALGEGGATWVNGPSLENWGMEFTAGYRHSTAYGLGYNVNGNIDFYRSKVTYLPENAQGSYEHTTTENLVTAKKAYGSLVGYVTDGLYQTAEEVAGSNQPGARLGGLKYVDINGDGTINSDDRTWIYNPVPNFSWGLNIELSYKDFDFTMFWQGVAGVDVVNNQKYQTDFWSITDPGSNKGSRVLGAWTLDNTSSTIPALTTSNGADEGRLSTYFIENGSYAKLRTLQLGYTLPKNIIKKLHIDNLRLYAQGENLWTIKSSSLTCTDPENTAWAYPHTSAFTFGLQVGF